MALFEVWRAKQRLLYTDSAKCIPDVSTQRLILKAGLTLKLNGKAIKAPAKP